MADPGLWIGGYTCKLRPLYRDIQTTAEVAVIGQIIDTAPDQIDLTVTEQRCEQTVFVDATPTPVGLISNQDRTEIMTAEAIALYLGMMHIPCNSLIFTDNQPLYWTLRNRKTKRQSLERLISRMIDIMDNKNVFVAWVPTDYNPADVISRCVHVH